MVDVSVAVVAVSDSCSTGQKTDKSGTLLKQLLKDTTKFADLVKYIVVPDDLAEIRAVLIDLSSTNTNVILTTGGTGFSPRDVTPEATKAVLERDAPGLVTALMNRSLMATPMAALSRLAAGIRHRTLIVNLPGSPNAVSECFEVLEPLLLHAVQLITEQQSPIVKAHAKMQA